MYLENLNKLKKDSSVKNTMWNGVRHTVPHKADKSDAMHEISQDTAKRKEIFETEHKDNWTEKYTNTQKKNKC